MNSINYIFIFIAVICMQSCTRSAMQRSGGGISGIVQETESAVQKFPGERMMYEITYPACPRDIDTEYYDLMLMMLDLYDTAFDMERYLRCLDYEAHEEQKGESHRESAKCADEYMPWLKEEMDAYTGSRLSNPEYRETAKKGIAGLRRYLEKASPVDLEDGVFNNAIIKQIALCKEMPAYKKIINGMADNVLETYMVYFSKVRLVSNDKGINLINSSQELEHCEESIKALGKMMDSGEYSKWLPMVWWRWRYLVQFYYGGSSKDSQIPNWYYNEKRLKCYFTVLRYLKSHEGDCKLNCVSQQ